MKMMCIYSKNRNGYFLNGSDRVNWLEVLRSRLSNFFRRFHGSTIRADSEPVVNSSGSGTVSSGSVPGNLLRDHHKLQSTHVKRSCRLVMVLDIFEQINIKSDCFPIRWYRVQVAYELTQCKGSSTCTTFSNYHNFLKIYNNLM